MQIKNTFTSGKMNKDTDVRLIPNNELIHVENLRFFSNGKNGAGQFIKGNEIVSDVTNGNTYTCIKAISDIENSNIYYFLANDTDSKIVKYNIESKLTETIIQGDLNFNPNKKILGANILYNNLYWTEQHNNAPRFVDTTKASQYALGFTEDDISIIKEPPFEEPKIVLTNDANVSEDIKDKWICFAYRYRYNDNSYSAVSFYSDWGFDVGSYFLDFSNKSNRGMQNKKNAAFIYFNTGGKNVIEIDLLFRESNTNNLYIIQTLNKAKEGYANNVEESFKFVNNKIYSPIPTEDVNSYYDNVPQQAKTQELIGNTLIYANYYDGYDQKDINGVGVDYEVKYTLNSERIDYSVIDSNTDTNDLVINFNATELLKGSTILLGIALADSQVRADYQEFVRQYSINLLNNYTTSEFILSDEFVSFIEILKEDFKKSIEGSFEAQKTAIITPDSTSFEVTESGNFVTIKKYTGTIEITEDVNGTPQITTEPFIYDFTDIGNDISFGNIANVTSLHSNRIYELCLIHYDKYNRIVGVATGKENTVYIPHKNLTYKNTISAEIKKNPPVGAVKYKFGIKESKKNHETVYVTRTYDDRIFKWLKLEYENLSKVVKGDVLIVKVLHGEIQQRYIELDVLDLDIKNYNFLGNNEEGGTYAKVNWIDVGVEFKETFLMNWFQHNGAKTSRAAVQTPPLNFGIPAGSSFYISINWDWNGDAVNFTGTFQAQTDYLDLFQMIEKQNIKFGAFEDIIVYRFYADIDWVGKKHYERRGDTFVFVTRRVGGDGGGASNIAVNIRISNGSEYMIFETKPKPNPDVLFYEVPGTYKIENGQYLNANDQEFAVGEKLELNAYNCYTFGNGVESYIYNDGLREKNNYLNFNFRGWATLEDGHKRTHRATDLIYSDVYRKETKFNGLSKFYSHLPNFKTLFEEYGDVQEIKNRDTDLFVAQESKLGKVMYGKSIIYSQAGEEIIQKSNEVLGSYVGFYGIHGISNNPESIAEFNKALYLADTKRGQILSIIGDQVKVISDEGFEDYTRRLFKDNSNLLGGFDPNNYEYLLYVDGGLNKTLSYQEMVGGFNTFYSYSPDFMLGVDKKLYTWKNGVMYEHDVTNDFNTYYGVKHPSKIEFSSNAYPSDDKIYTAMSIEDKEAWDIEVESPLGKTTIEKEEFVKKESFLFSSLNKNINEDMSNTYGIGVVKAILGNTIEISQVPIQMTIGDKICKDATKYDLTNRNETILTLSSVVGLSVGDYVYGAKNGLLDGGDIIGEYAVVRMSKEPNDVNSQLFAVNMEFIKSS